MTMCQRLFKEALNRWYLVDHIYPRCTPDGRFQSVQCDSGSCYCVDSKGREVTGTRLHSPVRKLNCDQPGECKGLYVGILGLILVYGDHL